MSDIMQDSNQLTPTQACAVLADLAENKIKILQTEAGCTQKAKRIRKRKCASDDLAMPLEACTPPLTSTNEALIPIRTPLISDPLSTEATSTDDVPFADPPLADNTSNTTSAIAHTT